MSKTLFSHFDNRKNVNTVFFFWGISFAVFGLSQIVSHNVGSKTTELGLIYRSQGLAQHVTDAGGICTLACIYFLCSLMHKNWIVFKLFLLFLSLLGLIYSGSVSGYLATAIGFMVVFAQSGKTYSLTKTFYLVFTLFLIWMIQRFNLFDIIGRVHHASFGQYNTFSRRWDNISLALTEIFHSFKIFFLGVGLDQDSGLFLNRDGNFLEVHNIFIQAFFQGGLFFVIGFSTFWVKAFQSLDKISFHFKMILRPMLVAAFVFGLTSPLMYSRYIWMPVLFVTALYLRGDADQNKVNFDSFPPTPLLHQQTSPGYRP
jgi:hypothetical protein